MKDVRPYLVACIYLVTLTILILAGTHGGWIAGYVVIGGFFSLLFGVLHRIEKSTEQSIMTAETQIVAPHLTEEDVARIIRKTLRDDGQDYLNR